MLARLEEFRFVRWVRRLNRITQVVLSLALVAGLNFVAARHYQRWDLTPNHRYSLTAETKSYLDQKVPRTPGAAKLQIILVDSPSALNDDDQIVVDQIRTLQKEYEEAAKNLPSGPIPLEIKEVDPDRQPTQAHDLEKFTSMAFSLAMPQVLVVRGDRGRALTKASLYDTEDKGAPGSGQHAIAATGFRGESAVTAAILDVLEDHTDTVYFTHGHGELVVDDTEPHIGLSQFTGTLRLNNYRTGTIDLTGQLDIPNDASTVVIVSSRSMSSFLPEEVAKLRRYLNERNGKVMLFMGPGNNLGLDQLLHEWGMVSPDLFIFEQDPSFMDMQHGYPEFHPLEDPKRSKHPILRQIAISGQNLVFGPPRPVEVDPTASEETQHQVHELLATTDKSYAELFKEVGAPLAKKIAGPFVVAAISERNTSDTVKVDLPGGKLLVFGDLDVATNAFFNNWGNSLLLLNSINYLTNHENVLKIRSQQPNESQIDMTTAKLHGLGWRLVLLPAGMALLGLLVCWIRSRS